MDLDLKQPDFKVSAGFGFKKLHGLDLDMDLDLEKWRTLWAEFINSDYFSRTESGIPIHFSVFI